VRRLVSLLAIAAALSGCHHKEAASPGSPCASARDCGGGLVCLAGSCAESAPQASTCTPPTTPRLVAGAAITAADPKSSCTTTIQSPAPGVSVQPLGQHTVGEQLTFDVPAGTWSVTIVSQAVAGTTANAILYQGSLLPNSVVPTNVRAPDGRVFYTDMPSDQPTDSRGYPDYTGLLSYYGGFTPIEGALTFPNTSAGLDAVRSAGGLPAGTWTLTVNDFAYECPLVAGCTGGSSTGKYDVQVITRPGPIASTGTLDFDVYLATATDPTTPSPLDAAASAASDPNLVRLFQSLSKVLGNAGLCLGTVSFHDLPAWARTRYASVNVDATGPCDELSQLFTLAQAPSTSVHLFLVDDLTETSTTNSTQRFRVVGIDGSIPGPSGVPGTINGGTVVPVWDLGHGQCGSSFDIANCGNDRLAYIVAHEAGHWLGLYHTTERYGSLFDPLSDTPACRCSVCAPLTDRASCAENDPRDASKQPVEPLSMIGDWCAREGTPDCGGVQDLMFWLLDDTRSHGALTPQQSEVMRLNPAVH
jgi:hypothetical protein